MKLADDEYRTIAEECEAAMRERSSKFLSLGFHVESEQEISEIVDKIKKKYYDATHHCYAWRLGFKGERWRANDDGEPSSSAGKPILGQLLSEEITNSLIVVIRWFGGTKLGIPGLIAAYRESAAEVIAAAKVELRTIDAVYEVMFGFEVMNEVMKTVKDLEVKILSQNFDNLCTMTVAIRQAKQPMFEKRLENAENIKLNFLEYR
jgi:uncharacterized YigZ family protein